MARKGRGDRRVSFFFFFSRRGDLCLFWPPFWCVTERYFSLFSLAAVSSPLPFLTLVDDQRRKIRRLERESSRRAKRQEGRDESSGRTPEIDRRPERRAPLQLPDGDVRGRKRDRPRAATNQVLAPKKKKVKEFSRPSRKVCVCLLCVCAHLPRF